MDGSREIKHSKRIRETKLHQIQRSLSSDKTKYKDGDWLKRIIDLSVGIKSECNILDHYRKTGEDSEARRDTLCAELLRNVLYFGRNSQLFSPYSVEFRVNKVDLDLADLEMIENQLYPDLNAISEDMIPMFYVVQNEFVIEKEKGSDRERILGKRRVTSNKDNDETSRHFDCLSLNVKVDMERSTADGQKELCTSKDLKIAGLLDRFKLAQYTINQQQSYILDLEKKILHIAEILEEKSPILDTSSSMELSDIKIRDIIDVIQFKINLLKKYECKIGKIKLSELNLAMELEEERKRKNRLEDSVQILYEIIDELQEKRDTSNTDVLVLHDDLLTHINTDLVEKQQLKMENVLCPTLSDALGQLQTYQGRAKVVIIHTGTSDLAFLPVEEMCDVVTEIHAHATNNLMKLILCNLMPNDEGPDIANKVLLFNSNIYARFSAYDNVTICKSNDINCHVQQPRGKAKDYNKNKENLMALRRHQRLSARPYHRMGKKNNESSRATLR